MGRLWWWILHGLLVAVPGSPEREPWWDLEFSEGTVKNLASARTPVVDGIVCRNGASRSERGLNLAGVVDGSGSTGSYGRCLFRWPVGRLNSSMSFRTYFEFAVGDTDGVNVGEGMAFILVPDTLEVTNSSGKYLGWLNSSIAVNSFDPSTRHLSQGTAYAVEIDTRQQLDVSDPHYHHVGLNNNSLTSAHSHPLESTRGRVRRPLSLLQSHSYSAWIEYNDASKQMTFALQDYENNRTFGKQRLDYRRLSLSRLETVGTYWKLSNIDLQALSSQEMYAGFSSSTSALDTPGNTFAVTYWSFRSSSASNWSRVGEQLGGGTRRRKRAMSIPVVATSVAVGVVMLVLVALVAVVRRRSLSRAHAEKELEEVLGSIEHGPKRFSFKELSAATRDFNSSEYLGSGGSGKVFKGTLLRDTSGPVAVKLISRTSKEAVKAFLAEVRTIGRLRHKNLVPLLGWCFEREQLMLVYEFMPNGSLDQAMAMAGPRELEPRPCSADAGVESPAVAADPVRESLSWKRRFHILHGVAAALVYLHEEWDQRVVHRDVKASNVLLDSQFNARLGDFGLAKLYGHSQDPESTVVVGTVGYVAPELSQCGKATDKTDVFAFGALALEVVCGRRPVDTRRPPQEIVLLNWVWMLHEEGRIMDSVDSGLLMTEDDAGPAQILQVLQLGLLCSHPDPSIRPSMRLVLQALEGEAGFPELPRSKPMSAFPCPPLHCPG